MWRAITPALGVLIGWSLTPSLLLAADPDRVTLAKQAREILRANCYRCHGQDGAVEGGFNYVLDFRSLLSRKMVKPGDPSGSRLLKRITSGQMPPEDESPRPSQADIASLKDWIMAGSPDPTEAPARAFVTTEAIFEAVQADLGAVEERGRPFARYFSLTHLYNAGLSEDELQSYRHGLSKLINSLSWGRRVVVPRPVDAARTLFRIDLRDLNWTEATWESILAANPYGVIPPSRAASSCSAATGCRLPLVRGDWFVAAASRPPLYHQVLGLPSTDGELETLLHVNAAEDIRTERVARAGFNGSGVSRNNRVIERHESPYGAYWKSYDFGSNTGRKNIFASPLGPGTGPLGFMADGGEIIFNLPNGLQAYMLVDAQGRRIDKGPINIVSDPKRPDRAVENGISCMSCHAKGMIEKSDQVRGSVEGNPGAFAAKDVGTILALYPPRQAFDALLEEDAGRFQRAVQATGGRAGATEPIVALTLRFESELDMNLAAAEAGLTPAEFKPPSGASPELSRSLGSLYAQGGTVQRQVFADAFADIVGRFGLGESYRPTRPSAPARPLRAPDAASPAAVAPVRGYYLFRTEGSWNNAFARTKNSRPDTEGLFRLNEDGSLVARNRGRGYIHTNRAFEDFSVSLEWRVAPGYKQSPFGSGLVIVKPSGPACRWLTDGVPYGLDFEIARGETGTIWMYGDASLNGRRTRNPAEPAWIAKKKAAERPPGEWNRYEVRCEGKTVTVTLNGVLVNQAVADHVIRGKIGLISHGTEVEFRNIFVQMLSDKE